MSFVLKIEDIAQALGTTKTRIKTAIKEIDAVPDDPWELKEGEDYIKAPDGSQIFSETGAHAVVKYLQDNPPKGFLGKFVEAFKEITFHYKARLRQQLVRVHLEKVGTLVLAQKDIYVQERQLVAAYRTKRNFLERIRNEYNRSHEEQIKAGEDYLDIDGVQCYSPKTVIRLKDQIQARPNYPTRRKEWIKDCTDEITAQVTAHQKQQKKFFQAITDAKKACRKKDKHKCQLTGTKEANGVLLHIHHLLPVHANQHLAYHPDNLITIRHDVHTQFHQWTAGTQAACTPWQFLEFVSQFYPDRYSEIKVRLQPLEVLMK